MSTSATAPVVAGGPRQRHMGGFRARPAILWLHRWMGVAMALVLIVEGLTGSVLAFRAPISHWLTPELYAQPPTPGAPRLDLASLAEAADRHLGDDAGVGYFFERGEDNVALRIGPRVNASTHRPYSIKDGWIVLDPWTGAELGRLSEGEYAHHFLGKIIPFLYELHVSLALGGTGAWILGIVALVWTLDCLWSVYLTLPRRGGRFWGRWGRSWRIKVPARVVRLNFDAHRAGGLWFWPLLFVYAWSSVQLTRADIYDRVTGTLFDYVGVWQLIDRFPHRGPAPAVLDWRSAQQAADRIVAERARIEHFHVLRRSLFAYFRDEHLYSFSVLTDRPLPAFHDYNIYVDGDTGELFSINRPTGEHVGDSITNWLRALHFASDPVDGVWYRTIIAITGVVIAMLSATGIYLWLKKRQGQSVIHERRMRLEES